MSGTTASPAQVRCPHCAYPAERGEKECSRCGHALPQTGHSLWPYFAVAAAVGLGAALALRSRKS